MSCYNKSLAFVLSLLLILPTIAILFLYIKESARILLLQNAVRESHLISTNRILRARPRHGSRSRPLVRARFANLANTQALHDAKSQIIQNKVIKRNELLRGGNGIGDLELEKSLKEGMQILVVSTGGVASNSLVDAIQLNGLGYQTETQAWHTVLCHIKAPPVMIGRQNRLANALKVAIYIYGDPILSICSMKQRGIALLNFKKMNRLEPDLVYSDKLFLQSMHSQFTSWRNAYQNPGSIGYPIAMLHHDESFSSDCLQRVFNRLDMRPPRPRDRKERRSTREACLTELVFDAVDIAMADEINNYRVLTPCTPVS